MKELSIEDKARRYDEAVKVINKCETDKYGCIVGIKPSDLFPELVESEDEKIRDFLISKMKEVGNVWKEYSARDIIAWLEKQSKASKVEEAMREVEQKAKAFTEANKGLTSDEILAQMRGYEWSEEDERIRKAIINVFATHKYYEIFFGVSVEDILAWLEKQGEQKVANSAKTCKVEPKFKVGDIIKPKDKGHEPWQIMQVDILNKEYRFKDGYVVHFSQEDAYELVDKKFTAWSEEDERNLEGIIDEIEANKHSAPDYDLATYDRFLDWLKSLKDRVQPQNTWKPTEDQISALEYHLNNTYKPSWQYAVTEQLLDDLKKL